MASEDVIELGSSDDEPEPAPKKRKSVPNAMVHIPTKFHGVTIKPAKSKTIPIKNKNVGKGLKVNPVNFMTNVHVNKNKPIGSPVQISFKQRPGQLQKPLLIQNNAIVNTVNLMKKLNNSQVKISKVPANLPGLKNPVKVQNQNCLTNLPPSITITRKTGCTKDTDIASNISHKRKRPQQISNKNHIGDVLTVELDDDDISTSSTSNLQWYLRPEEVVEPNQEEQNNKEPDPSKFIEITIEDSPVKPVQNKHHYEIGSQLAIIIEDSPVKTGTEQLNNGSDDDRNICNRSPQSRKKLEYPKEIETNAERETVVIEIEPIKKQDIIDKDMEEVCVINEEVGETSDLPRVSQNQQKSTPKLDNPLTVQEKVNKIEAGTQNVKDCSEFHPIYQSFIDLCFQLENSDDMKKIVEKKIKTYYRQVPKEYTESEMFIDMVSSKIHLMKAEPEKMYLYIKDVVDELNLQRKSAKVQSVNTGENNIESDKFLYGEESEFDSKRQRQIRKLEKTLKKLHRAIQKLEEQEVDFDDEEDSVYLLTERYKERMVQVHAKFCQLTNTKMPSEPYLHLEARTGQPTGPAKRLEKWINRKVPLGTPLPFPDFHDVLRCVRESNEEDNLGWNEADIIEEARDLFTRCGKKLQRRRQENEWRLAASRISLNEDPAEKSEDLKKKLEVNKQLASKKEIEVLNKYADRQKQLKLEAEEIGDKEAEDSPVESEDDETKIENTSLDNKKKRTERLKRLLQQKINKSISVENENNSISTAGKNQSQTEIVPGEMKENPNGADNINQSQENKINIAQNENNKMEIDLVNQTDILVNNEESVFHDIEQPTNDDNKKVESDIDELHLLEKLYSDDEINTSTIEFVDSGTSVANTDAAESCSDVANKENSSGDIISIENSSYSESEICKDYENAKNNHKYLCNDEVECHDIGTEKQKHETAVVSDCVENILLASSDDEVSVSKDTSPDGEICVNLKDDSLFIGETVIEGANFEVSGLDNECERNNLSKVISKQDYTEPTAKVLTSGKDNTQDIEDDQNNGAFLKVGEELNKDKINSLETLEVSTNNIVDDIHITQANDSSILGVVKDTSIQNIEKIVSNKESTEGDGIKFVQFTTNSKDDTSKNNISDNVNDKVSVETMMELLYSDSGINENPAANLPTRNESDVLND